MGERNDDTGLRSHQAECLAADRRAACVWNGIPYGLLRSCREAAEELLRSWSLRSPFGRHRLQRSQYVGV
jgi:hypothetical protein